LGRGIAVFLLAFTSLATHALGQDASKPGEALYLQLGQVGLDPSRVYQVRDASLERGPIHISLTDGTIAFTQDVLGKITGAFFEGDGEVLLVPPTNVERRSMSEFTGMAILEEHFATAYFRFNDDAATEMRTDLRAAENTQEFADHWSQTAHNLASTDAMRLMVSFSRLLPSNGAPSTGNVNLLGKIPDHFFHGRLQGTKLGIFDVVFDTLSAEQVEAGQARTGDNGASYYDVWTSFTVNAAAKAGKDVNSSSGPGNPSPREDWIAADKFTIKTQVQPPKQIHAQARVQLQVNEGGTRAMLFELSRFLQVESVKLNGKEVEFIHNPSVEGTQLSRRGNDVLVVILPEAAQSGTKLDLDFVYGGEVLAEAGSGLLYVGARGTWYPNRGMAMADFDLEFEYPPGWTLVATGKPSSISAEGEAAKAKGEQVFHWISERPIPFAGFNLGKYKQATVQAGNVTVDTYATASVEKDFPSVPIQVIDPPSAESPLHSRQMITPSVRPSPMQNEMSVGESAARAIRYYSERFGPYPYSRLELTQMPGRESQGWPGLVFLSSYAFLTNQEREDLHFEPVRIVLQEIVPAHETAHQWWGDLIGWSTYRDQWLSEGLANYCAMMMLQERNPEGFRSVMDRYRDDLIATNKDGHSFGEAGPVTLGTRLLSSRFPEGYEAISYGRGTWLFHMLRTMLRDAAAQEGKRKGQGLSSTDEPFVRALFKVRQRYEGKSISTRELLNVMAEDLPPSLRYEGKKSLDWFLESWINGTAIPRLELKAVKFTPKDAGVVVSGTILQKDASNDLVTSVPVYAVGTGKQMTLLGRVFADGEESTFHVSAPAGTRKVVIDPYQTILTSQK